MRGNDTYEKSLETLGAVYIYTETLLDNKILNKYINANTSFISSKI